MTSRLNAAAMAVDTAQRRMRAIYTAFTLSVREVCHVVPGTDRLSVCAALTGAETVQ